MATRTLVSDTDSWRVGLVTPQDQNLLGWTFDPAVIATATGFGAGSLYMFQLVAAASGTVGNLHMHINTAGSGLTSGQCLAGLYSFAGSKLAETADQSGSWNSSGLKSMALTSPPAVVGGTKYWVVVLFNGSGPPSFSSGLASPVAVNVGLSAANYRIANQGAALTALPASFTPAANAQYSAMFWAAIGA